MNILVLKKRRASFYIRVDIFSYFVSNKFKTIKTMAKKAKKAAKKAAKKGGAKKKAAKKKK